MAADHGRADLRQRVDGRVRERRVVVHHADQLPRGHQRRDHQPAAAELGAALRVFHALQRPLVSLVPEGAVLLQTSQELGLIRITIVADGVLVRRLPAGASAPGAPQDQLFGARITQVEPDALEPDAFARDLHRAPQHQIGVGVAGELVCRREDGAERIPTRR